MNGLGSPLPPWDSWQPYDVLRALRDHDHVGRGRADVLRGDVGAIEDFDRVGEVEQHVVPQRPAGAAAGAAQITPLPPPTGTPAAAALKVIARASLSASRAASAELA